VDGVDFELARNRAVVIVGESGCGKTSMAKAILRLLPKNVDTYSGKIL
jgi:ABC-type dipeptide/oligopeptide/nickel transport system ATPase component